jgi:hypothetical protein
MHRLLTSVLVLAFLVVTIAGCGKGDGKLRAKGRLLKGGEEYIPDEDEFIQITFVPIPEDKKPAMDYYWAEVDQDTGTFAASGKDLKGLPPGKYRIAVELKKNKKDLLGGKYDAEKSPFVFDIEPDSEEIIIDLDEPPQVSGI